MYVDTSVVGGCFNEQFREHSLRLFEAAERQEIELLLSDVLVAETALAPEEVRSFLMNLASVAYERIKRTTAADFLAERYIMEEVVSVKSRMDALHVACATVAAADVIVSWDTRHLVKRARIRGFNRVNEAEGFAPIDITTPKELLNG
ncbi:MAG: PIN domain-containing protein [Candidatus Hydrogenedentes bacterium]|nr:PIN domain-containing protein [Candidatus Hydrogenedentota bacterium]